MLKKLGIHPLDAILFLVFSLAYAVIGVLWTLNMTPYGPSDGGTTLQLKKDLMYYALWACAAGYAIVANSLVLGRKAPAGGIIAFPITVGAMIGVFVALTALTATLNKTIPPSTKLLSIAIGDLLVLLPVVTAVIIFLVALIGAGVTNHLRAQPVTQGFLRLGVALMLMPLIQFLAIVVLPRWEDEVRGVVFVHAMGLGLMWGLFLGGAIGSNLRRPASTETATA